MKRREHQNPDIRNIFIVLGSAVVCAGLLAALFIYYYGPTGHYLAGYIILDPTVIEHMNHQESQATKKNQKTRMLLDRIDFSYFVPERGQVRQPVAPENYHVFYPLIASDSSLNEVTEKIEKTFIESPPATLTVTLRMLDSGSSPKLMTQTMQFVKEDYYRVQLQPQHGQHQGEWVYFYHPHIYQEVMRLFTPTKNL